MEKEIVKLAAQRRSDDDLENIKNALNQRNLTKSSFIENSEADLEFHLAIAKASHNSIFTIYYKSLSLIYLYFRSPKIKINKYGRKNDLSIAYRTF